MHISFHFCFLFSINIPNTFFCKDMYLTGTIVFSLNSHLLHFLPLLLLKYNCSILALLRLGAPILSLSIYHSHSLFNGDNSVSLSLRQIINTPTIPPVQSPFPTQPACSGKLPWRPGSPAGSVHDAYRRLRPQGYCPLNNGRKRPLSSILYFSSFPRKYSSFYFFYSFCIPFSQHAVPFLPSSAKKNYRKNLQKKRRKFTEFNNFQDIKTISASLLLR